MANVDACSRGDFRGCPNASNRMVFFLFGIDGGNVSVKLCLLFKLFCRLLRRPFRLSSSVVLVVVVVVLVDIDADAIDAVDGVINIIVDMVAVDMAVANVVDRHELDVSFLSLVNADRRRGIDLVIVVDALSAAGSGPSTPVASFEFSVAESLWSR